MQDELLRELEEHSGSDLFTLSVATENVSFSDESGANDVSQENDELQVYVTQDHMLRMLHEQSQNDSLTLSVLRENVVLDQRFDLHSGSTEDARRIEETDAGLSERARSKKPLVEQADVQTPVQSVRSSAPRPSAVALGKRPAADEAHATRLS